MGGSAGASEKYNDQMAQAAAQMESINSLYKAQLESATRQAEINQDSIENATKLKEQMHQESRSLLPFFEPLGSSVADHRNTIQYLLEIHEGLDSYLAMSAIILRLLVPFFLHGELWFG